MAKGVDKSEQLSANSTSTSLILHSGPYYIQSGHSPDKETEKLPQLHIPPPHALIMITYDDRDLYTDEELAEFKRQAKLRPRPTPEQHMISCKWVSMLSLISAFYPVVVLYISIWMNYELDEHVILYTWYPVTFVLIVIGYIRLYCYDDMVWTVWDDEEESADEKKVD